MTLAALPRSGKVLLVCLLAAACSARADQPLWEAGAGIAALRLPHYRGSDRSAGWLLPLPYFVYRGDVLRADRNGARALLFDGDRVDVDLGLAASARARSGNEGSSQNSSPNSNESARQGMPDLQPSVEIGPRLNARLAGGDADAWRLALRVPLRAVVGIGSTPRHLGWTLAPVLNLDLRLPEGLDAGLQAGPLWGDRRLHGHYYGVGPAYATAVRPAYSAPGGRAGWQATAGLSRRSGRLWMGAFVRADSVGGAAFAGSPLVRQRSNLSGGLAMAWVFATSSQRVGGDAADE